jgi:hypothetical protein
MPIDLIPPSGVGECRHANHGIQFEKGYRRRRIVEVDFAGLHLLFQSIR